MKITLPLRRVVTADFTAALTALCRAKGLDVKHAWPLAEVKRIAADTAKRFEDARVDAIERHGLGGETATQSGTRAFAKEVGTLLETPVEFGIEQRSISVAPGALTGDVIEQVMEFLVRPE